ncbi:MAG: hypothetical protein H0Z24_03130 [Thermosipho sp. (in: Bacteria)]|nr:hypothetical protein [Thermosipho sp. (in: thermotogales)]
MLLDTIKIGLGKAKNRNNKLEKVLHLKDKLVKLGYNPSEIDYLINIRTGGQKISKVSIETLKEVEEMLDNQVKIALKCIEKIQMEMM